VKWSEREDLNLRPLVSQTPFDGGQPLPSAANEIHFSV
jgi:hypothetical protein